MQEILKILTTTGIENRTLYIEYFKNHYCEVSCRKADFIYARFPSCRFEADHSVCALMLVVLVSSLWNAEGRYLPTRSDNSRYEHIKEVLRAVSGLTTLLQD
ncbi:hypothetical protein CEXT_419111 [Caerostris extrusa]|uniref:Uncharacterized protein n=1 Tax=Caerostris extrusa TaxID=172846 RepID=A0AAV4UUF6_CAEEX|nr:hypothetical protein CEXT_419111 [Caerostris extrusa]